MRELRLARAREQPERSHDLTWLRTEVLRRCALEAAYPSETAEVAFAVFLSARNALEPYTDVRPALSTLALRYPLFALSNGNADVVRVGLGAFFTGAVSAADAGCAKPDPRIFAKLVAEAGVEPGEILHVGDDPLTDVEGARAAGLKSVWVNRSGIAWPDGVTRADLEVTNLSELVALLLSFGKH
jgi:putative hydrolase of the HAD superfamily